LYPIRIQGELQGKSVESILAERGRKWWDLITAPTICQQHSGPAYMYKHTYDERIRVCHTELRL
jgi:hypothetical protein